MRNATFLRRSAERNTGRRSSLLSVAVSLAVAHCVVSDARAALSYAVGPAETIYTKAQRGGLGLPHWPDGSMGVVPLGNGQYDFYAANSSAATKTTGTLEHPGQFKQSVSIFGLRDSFNYVSGGPVYFDATTGARMMIYHAEKHASSDRDYYSMLGMAVSRDAAGRNFQDLGVIIQPNIPMNERQFSIDVGGGSFAVLNNQLHVYYRDYLADGSNSQLAVARAPLADILTNALNSQPTSFTKYYNGGWTEAGVGGRSSPLEIGNPANTWSAVAYNEYLNGLVMVTSEWEMSGAGGDLYMSTSIDGVNWGQRQPIAMDPGEQMYPSIIGKGPDPLKTGRSFYAYYTDSASGVWNRWNDAKLVRREITLDPVQIPDPDPGEDPDWTAVAGFKQDYQKGGPAAGWTYAWNPNGKLGNASQYAPLYWSQIADSYNTTGAATQAWNGRSHNDDYLSLNGDWGHPGQANYYAIAGYTIQPSDGDGVYRLASGLVRKTDALSSSGEDGLDLWVYLNNTPLGPLQQVATNGGATTFSRDLGQLSVGNTVYVMIGAGKNQYYDAFTSFDFRIERSDLAPLPPPETPPPPVWTALADYKDDLRTGGPAAGWRYMWTAGGKVGAASSYAPLYWSDVAGAYNTTGGATTVWNGASHPDDYLSLYPGGAGHPGRANYHAIAAYTIQADDGSGLYRISASTIMKSDGVASPTEDGLEVFVFVNNLQIGSLASIATSGALTGFDRALGSLNIGDSIYVIVGGAKNNNYDFFTNFDFTIEKLQAAATLAATAIPEPSSATLLVSCVLIGGLRRRPRSKR